MCRQADRQTNIRGISFLAWFIREAMDLLLVVCHSRTNNIREKVSESHPAKKRWYLFSDTRLPGWPQVRHLDLYFLHL